MSPYFIRTGKKQAFKDNTYVKLLERDTLFLGL